MRTLPSLPWQSAMMLALDSQSVVGLRLFKLALGGPAALDEACLMVSEKVMAALQGSLTLASGGSVATVINAYRGHVCANIERLTLGQRGPDVS
jgi:hypothetical protein